MNKKALIIFGSAKKTGDVGALVDAFASNFAGSIEYVYAFPHLSTDHKGILPCIDCGFCSKNVGCYLKDDFNKILDNSYDIIVLAAPIYDYILPGPVMNIISRFNSLWHNRRNLGIDRKKTSKIGVLILTAGGTESPRPPQGLKLESLSLYYAKWIFSALGAKFDEVNIASALACDSLPLRQNKQVVAKVKEIAKRLCK